MSSTVELFDAETIGRLSWPETVDGNHARSYLLPFIAGSVSSLIANVKTTCMALVVDGSIVLPITVNEQEYDNSYVCSPYSHYVTYAREELVLLKQAWLRRALFLLIGVFGWLCKK